MIKRGDPFIIDTVIEVKRRLAKMLKKGDGVPQDKQRARLLQQEAEKQQLEEGTKG